MPRRVKRGSGAHRRKRRPHRATRTDQPVRSLVTVPAVCICGTVWFVTHEDGAPIPKSPCCPGVLLHPDPRVVEAFGG